MQQKFTLIQTIAECFVAVVAMLAIVLKWPILRSRAALIAELVHERRASADLRKALDLTKLGNEAMQAAINGLTREVQALAHRLDDVDQKWKLGIAYICEVIRHQEARGNAHDLPPIPEALRADVDDALAELRGTV